MKATIRTTTNGTEQLTGTLEELTNIIDNHNVKGRLIEVVHPPHTPSPRKWTHTCNCRRSGGKTDSVARFAYNDVHGNVLRCNLCTAPATPV